MKKRNASVELFRCILMFMIVLYHAAVHGAFRMADCPGVFFTFVALLVWHVDGFLSITGWFGTKFSFARFFKLAGLILFYTIPTFVWGLHNGASGRGLIAGGWFGHAYLIFLFFIPLLNSAINYLISCDKRILFTSLAVLNLGVLINWCPYSIMGANVGSGVEGCSIVTFFVIYMNVRLLKLSGFFDKCPKEMLLGIMLCFPICLLFGGTIRMLVKMVLDSSSWSWNYWLLQTRWASGNNAPHVMIMAIASLVFFEKYVSIPDWLGKIVLWLSPLMFGVYIIHDTTGFGRQLYIIPQVFMRDRYAWSPACVVFISAVVTFFSCVVIESVRRFMAIRFMNFILNKIEKLDAKYNF